MYQQLKQAEGMERKAEALKKLVNTYGSPHNYIMSRMIDEELLVKIAKENANAIHGLNPKITVWSGNGEDAMHPIKNLARNLIPTLDIIKDQTGYSFPDWLIKKSEPSTDQSPKGN
jgi:flotillin